MSLQVPGSAAWTFDFEGGRAAAANELGLRFVLALGIGDLVCVFCRARVASSAVAVEAVPFIDLRKRCQQATS